MNSAHKTTNKNYRDHYDENFRKEKEDNTKEKEDNTKEKEEK